MAHVVCEPCNDCKYTNCAEVCPVECFYEGPNQLFINPEECIDCGACVPVCPVHAIFPDNEVPEKWTSYVEQNASEAAKFPRINKTKEPLLGEGCIAKI